MGKTCLRENPRLCGERQDFGPERVTLMGKPPPVRGKERQDRIPPLVQGKTPACAGKGREFTQAVKRLVENPRLCGDGNAFGRQPPFRPGPT